MTLEPSPVATRVEPLSVAKGNSSQQIYGRQFRRKKHSKAAPVLEFLGRTQAVWQGGGVSEDWGAARSV
jgi:hypothetical protein